jgi:hypothetical protein
MVKRAAKIKRQLKLVRRSDRFFIFALISFSLFPNSAFHILRALCASSEAGVNKQQNFKTWGCPWNSLIFAPNFLVYFRIPHSEIHILRDSACPVKYIVHFTGVVKKILKFWYQSGCEPIKIFPDTWWRWLIARSINLRGRIFRPVRTNIEWHIEN